MIISLIAAVAENGVIGVDGDLPWSLPDDMRHFASTTRGHHVLTGRKNYLSIPEKYRPLPGRPNIVVTRDLEFNASGAHVFHDIETAIEWAKEQGENELFIIGGGEIYAQTIEMADKLYITHVADSPEGHTFFPKIDFDRYEAEEIQVHPKDDVHNFSFRICVYRKK